MAVAGIFLIMLATARFAVDCANIFDAFIRRDPRSARLAYLQDVKEPLFTTKHSLFIADLLVGDSFVVSAVHLARQRHQRSCRSYWRTTAAGLCGGKIYGW